MKLVRQLRTCSCVRVVLKSLLEVPSPRRTPSIRNPRVAVDEMVSRHTMYLKETQQKGLEGTGGGIFFA